MPDDANDEDGGNDDEEGGRCTSAVSLTRRTRLGATRGAEFEDRVRGCRLVPSSPTDAQLPKAATSFKLLPTSSSLGPLVEVAQASQKALHIVSSSEVSVISMLYSTSANIYLVAFVSICTCTLGRMTAALTARDTMFNAPRPSQSYGSSSTPNFGGSFVVDNPLASSVYDSDGLDPWSTAPSPAPPSLPTSIVAATNATSGFSSVIGMWFVILAYQTLTE